MVGTSLMLLGGIVVGAALLVAIVVLISRR